MSAIWAGAAIPYKTSRMAGSWGRIRKYVQTKKQPKTGNHPLKWNAGVQVFQHPSP